MLQDKSKLKSGGEIKLENKESNKVTKALKSYLTRSEIPKVHKEYIRIATLTIISRDKPGVSSIAIKSQYDQRSKSDIQDLTNQIMRFVDFFDDDIISNFTDWVMLELKTTDVNGLGCLYKDVTSGWPIEIANFLTQTC